MSFFSSLFGPSKRVFTPWEHDYFARRIDHEKSLVAAASRGQVAGYDVVDEHEGGMGRVLIARGKDGLIALKQLKPNKLDAEAADQLADEAAKLIGLDPFSHLVPEDIIPDVLAQGCTVVLPYCGGGSLADRAQFGPLEFDELAYYSFILAAELKELHSLGILHLDLKPANVLLQKAREPNVFHRWRALVSDYGLSVYRQPGRPVASLGGTPLFMSPEQLLGFPVETPSDVWSYAATLYYLACAQSPMHAVWPLPRDGRTNKTVTPLCELRNDIPDWLSDLLGRCLVVNPADRVQTFDEVLDHLLRFVRIEDDKKTKSDGAAGPERTAASLVVRDSYALTYAKKHGLSMGSGTILRIDLGWFTKLTEAEQLFRTYRAGPSRKALGMIDSVLGRWETPGSVLAQFAANPRQAQFVLPDDYSVNERGARSVNVPIPLSEVWHLLDLRCRLLVTIAEDLGRSSDVAELLETATRWNATQSFGPPMREQKETRVISREKCIGRIAQGFRLAGEFDHALALLEEAHRGDPTDLAALVVHAYCLRDLRRYDEALEVLKEAVNVCFEQQRKDIYAMVGFSMAELRLRQGDLEVAELSYKQLSEMFESPQLALGLLLVEGRRNGAFQDPPSVASWSETLLTPGVAPDVVVGVAELQYWAGQRKRCFVLATQALRDPRMRLPTWGYFRGAAEHLVAKSRAGRGPA